MNDVMFFAVFCLTIVAIVAIARTQSAADKALDALLTGSRVHRNRTPPSGRT